MNEYFESPLLDGGEDLEEREEQVGNYQVIFQELGKDQQVNNVLQHLRPLHNCNDGMQPTLDLYEEGQPLEERKYLIRERQTLEE